MFKSKRKSYFKLSEFLLAIMTLMWGVWLLLPFDSYAHSEVFRLLATLVTEVQAGSIMGITGFVWVILILTGNFLGLRRYWVLMALFFWVILDIVYIIGNFSSTATVVNSGIVVLITITYSEILEEIGRRRICP